MRAWTACGTSLRGVDASPRIKSKRLPASWMRPCKLAKGSALDIPAGYGSQESEVRSQNGAGVGVQKLAHFLEKCREPVSITIAEVVCQDQIVAAFFEGPFRQIS